jgi:TolB protein
VPAPPTAAASATPTSTASTASTAAPTPTTSATPLLALTGRILFTAAAPTEAFGSIYVMNADGSGRVKLTGTLGGDEPSWSPDGKLIAFLRKDGIWVMRADGSGARQIRHDSKMVDQWPAWSPDGRRISFVESPACGLCSIGIPFAVNVMNADGSGVRALTDKASSLPAAWSPDGRTVVFSSEWTSGLQSIRLDGSGLRQLTKGPDGYPTWSADGRLAFLRGATTAADGTILYSLVVANADGSAEHEVHLPFVAGGPLAWSPDGAWIALTGITALSTLPAVQSDIWIVHPDGTGAMAITNTPDLSEGFPAWAPRPAP